MKTKGILLAVFSLFMAGICHGEVKQVESPVPISAESLINISKSKLSDEEIIESFYRENIPAEYNEAFLYYTKDCPEIRMHFYSLMLHESAGFRYFRNVNKNGSVDMGPSQLNSANLKNPRFVNAFKPKDESKITSVYCYYMVMTIGYYHDLFKRHGEKYAFYAYNGGDKAVRMIKKGETTNGSLVKNVTSYNTAVRKIIDRETKKLNEYVELTRLYHVVEVYNEFSEYLNKVHKSGVISDNTDRRRNIDNSINYISLNNTPYLFKREDLLNLESEELIVEYYSLTGVFYN